MRRELVWLKKPDFHGWSCSQCAWLFNPSDAIDGNTIDEMKQYYEVQRDKAFASHSCADHARTKSPETK